MTIAAGAAEGWEGLDLAAAASMPAVAVLASLGTSESGLDLAEASHRLGVIGSNAILSCRARRLQVLLRQLSNPLLILLVGAALISILVGEYVDALIIPVIVGLSVELRFLNECRPEKAVEELHSTIRHTAVATRGGRAAQKPQSRVAAGGAASRSGRRQAATRHCGGTPPIEASIRGGGAGGSRSPLPPAPQPVLDGKVADRGAGVDTPVVEPGPLPSRPPCPST